MGKINKKLDSFFNNPIDYTLLITVLLLLALGLIMVLSASSPTALSESGNSYSYNSSTYNSVLYVLKYQVPDVESGKHIVAICVSDDKEEVYKGFGYISVDKKQ